MYATRLPDMVRKHLGDQKLNVWTSTMKRTIATAQHLPYPKKTWKALDELDAGLCDGMTYEEIEVCPLSLLDAVARCIEQNIVAYLGKIS